VGTVRHIVSVALFVGLVCAGCGSDGNNDQGIAFRAVGLFIGDISEQRCTAPTTDQAIADPGISLPLGLPQLDLGYPNVADAFFVCHGYLWLQNDLFKQAIVVDRIDYTYEVPGARVAIPSHSAPVGFRINPADAPPETTQNPFGQVNVFLGHLTGQLVPARIISFLRQNEPSLPQLPYVMIVHLTARGRTDNGDEIVSNEVRYTIEWIPGTSFP